MPGIFAQGFFLGFSLILAIGAQNAFVLRQGLRGEHVFAVALTCALSDALLIAAGVAGFTFLAERVAGLAVWMTLGGAAFLVVYGGLALRSALTAGTALAPSDEPRTSLSRALAICLFLTWANPHVYLDTLVLIGSLSTGFGELSWIFGAGAVVASFVFFFTLAYGAGLLRPFFARPAAWRVLDAIVGLTMWAIAANLIRGQLALH